MMVGSLLPALLEEENKMETDYFFSTVSERLEAGRILDAYQMLFGASLYNDTKMAEFTADYPVHFIDGLAIMAYSTNGKVI
jgi:protein involved in sex pheromone biosynthesis